MQCQNVLSTRWPVDLCACIGHLCFSSCGFFFGAVVDDVKSRLCLHWVQCCSVFDPAMNLLFAPLTPFSVSYFWCVPLDIVQTVDYRAVWSLCISQYVYSTWVCMAVVVIIFILILIDIYFCFAWLIQRKVQVSYQCLIKWDVHVTSLFYPSCVPCDSCIVNVS